MDGCFAYVFFSVGNGVQMACFSLHLIQFICLLTVVIEIGRDIKKKHLKQQNRLIELKEITRCMGQTSNRINLLHSEKVLRTNKVIDKNITNTN